MLQQAVEEAGRRIAAQRLEVTRREQAARAGCICAVDGLASGRPLASVAAFSGLIEWGVYRPRSCGRPSSRSRPASATPKPAQRTWPPPPAAKQPRWTARCPRPVPPRPLLARADPPLRRSCRSCARTSAGSRPEPSTQSGAPRPDRPAPTRSGSRRARPRPHRPRALRHRGRRSMHGAPSLRAGTMRRPSPRAEGTLPRGVELRDGVWAPGGLPGSGRRGAARLGGGGGGGLRQGRACRGAGPRISEVAPAGRAPHDPLRSA